ncbi:MAG: NAD(P)-dependent oxidoreductase [Anaerolineales bacterium]
MAQEKLGVVGLGAMGSGIAHNLVSAGADVTVWNRTAAKMEPLVAAGAKSAAGALQVAQAASIIFVCVNDTPDVQQVVLGDGGIADGASPGDLIIDNSTISPQVTREIASQLLERGIHMLDAPISGGPEGAAAGTLSLMVGGEREQFDRASPYFEIIGRTITHVGDNGDGQMVKLVNQILVVGHALAMSEAFLFAAAGGLDLERTLQAVSAGAAGSWMLDHRAPQMIRRDWSPGFTIDMQEKDVKLALAAASELAVPLLVTGMVDDFYRVLQKSGLGGEGNHALVKALERLAGFQLGDS